MPKVDTKGILALFIGVLVLVSVVDGVFDFIDDAVQELNESYTTAGKPKVGNLLVKGWDLMQLVIGIGLIVLAGTWLTKQSGSM